MLGSMKRRITYIDVTDSIVHLNDIIMVFLQTVFISFGIPAALILLMVVEIISVNDGTRLFLDEGSASLTSIALIVINMIIEFMIVHKERSEGYNRPTGKVWSLRLIVDGIKYRLGIGSIFGMGKEWKPKPVSPASRFVSMRIGITVAIFILALSGRMHDAIIKVSAIESADGKIVDVPIGEGIADLLTLSTLQDVMNWVGGTVLTMVAIISAQSLTHHNAERVMEIKEDMKKRKTVIKANETKARNKAQIEVHDLYTLDKVRDNTLRPIRIGKVYKCPVCGKEMSRQGWSGHPCRFEIDAAGLNLQAVDYLDNSLTRQEGQEAVKETASSQPTVNGNGKYSN